MTYLSSKLNPDLMIRLIAQKDAQNLLDAVQASRFEIAQWENWALFEPTLEIEQDFIAKQMAAHESKTLSTFVILDNEHTHQGIASEACTAVAAYAFATYGFERIELVMQINNVASRRVAEKCGATFEGILRSRLFYDGDGRDAAMYSLLKSDI